MFDLNFIEKLCPNVPKHQKDKFMKYVFIVGLDKIYKKGFMNKLDLQKIKLYKGTTISKNVIDKVMQKGRICASKTNEDEASIKKEIQNLKKEINNLAKNLEKKPESAKIEIRSSSTKKIHSQINKKEIIQDVRKRASSFDKKLYFNDQFDHHKNNEVTPKITQTVPQQIFQNFNINISKHHLDDTEIKEVFHNQCLLQMNSANKRKQSRQVTQQVSKTYNNPIISHSVKPPKGKENTDSFDHFNAQKIKERYEQDLKTRSSVSMKNEKQKTYVPVQRLEINKQLIARQNNQKKCHYDPNAHVSDLPYNQNQPQSKIKDYVDQARKNYQKTKEQITPQEQSNFYESQREQNDSVLNTANFTNKNLNIEFSKPKYYDQPQRFEELYKSTVTSVLNEDNSQNGYNQGSQFQEQDSQNQNTYNNNRSQQSDNNNRDQQNIHSNSFSQQMTKRSQASKEEMTFINSQQSDHDNQFKNKERGSKSVQAIQQPQFNQQKHPNKEHRTKLTQQSYGLSSQKMSLEFSAQKQSQYLDRGQNKNNLYPRMMDNDENRSSGSSNFSVFNPNEDLKNFFQNDFLEKRKQNQNNSIHQDARTSISSSHQSESVMAEKQSNTYENERWFKKKAAENANASQDEIVKSNVFQNNRLSVTRILSNSQF